LVGFGAVLESLPSRDHQFPSCVAFGSIARPCRLHRPGTTATSPLLAPPVDQAVMQAERARSMVAVSSDIGATNAAEHVRRFVAGLHTFIAAIDAAANPG
jgi:hypothetical protein